jgi:hypothetical protein
MCVWVDGTDNIDLSHSDNRSSSMDVGTDMSSRRYGSDDEAGPSGTRQLESTPSHTDGCSYHVKHLCECGEAQWHILHPHNKQHCSCGQFNLLDPGKLEEHIAPSKSDILKDMHHHESKDHKHSESNPSSFSVSSLQSSEHTVDSVAPLTRQVSDEESQTEEQQTPPMSYNASVAKSWKTLISSWIQAALFVLIFITPIISLAVLCTTSRGNKRLSRLVFFVSVLIEMTLAGIGTLVFEKNLPVFLMTIVAVLVFGIFAGSFLDIMASYPST